MNVQKVNNETTGQDSYKSLLLLDEIAKDEKLSQRDLSNRLNIALGLVNSYIKNLVSKGYVTIREIPAKRYTYYLTPKGFAEKTRLTYHHLQNYTSLYRDARRDFKDLFRRLSAEGVRTVVFAGVDEMAEIAYLSLQETDISLAAIADDSSESTLFFKYNIAPLDELKNSEYDRVVITTFLRADLMQRLLDENGVPKERICRLTYLKEH